MGPRRMKVEESNRSAMSEAMHPRWKQELIGRHKQEK